MNIDEALADMQRWEWQRDYFARRDEEARLARERAEAERLAPYLDPNSALVMQARAEAEAARAKPKPKPKEAEAVRPRGVAEMESRSAFLIRS